MNVSKHWHGSDFSSIQACCSGGVRDVHGGRAHGTATPFNSPSCFGFRTLAEADHCISNTSY